MPPLKNAKHEAFAQEYSRHIIDPNENPSAMNTHRKVYSSSMQNANDNAWRITGNEGVQTRMGEILERVGFGKIVRAKLLEKLSASPDEWLKLATIKEGNRVDGITDQPDQTNINIPEGLGGLVGALADVRSRLIKAPLNNRSISTNNKDNV